MANDDVDLLHTCRATLADHSEQEWLVVQLDQRLGLVRGHAAEPRPGSGSEDQSLSRHMFPSRRR